MTYPPSSNEPEADEEAAKDKEKDGMRKIGLDLHMRASIVQSRWTR